MLTYGSGQQQDTEALDKVRLTGNYDTIYLGHLENLLRHAGIKVEMRNQFSAGGMGELPAIDVMPELWVEKDMLTEAEVILRQSKKPQEQLDIKPWACPICGEQIEGQFSQCWQCGYWFKEEK